MVGLSKGRATAREESGEGSVFGHQVSAYLMARLACRTSYASFCNSPIVEVTLQASWLDVPFDDQVVTVNDGFKYRRHLLQCKLKLTVQPGDIIFQKLLSRIYLALVSGDGILEDDLFVIVSQECPKFLDISTLLEFAAGSATLVELRAKLASERRSLTDLLDAFIDALNKCKSKGELKGHLELDESVVHNLLRRLRFWKCDLNNEGSQDRRHAESGLLAFCSYEAQRALRLYEVYNQAASKAERSRTTYTWDLLREKFGGLVEPRPPGAAEQALSSERVTQLDGEVDLAIAQMTTRTFESYQILRSFIEERLNLIHLSTGDSSIEAKTFLNVCGKATFYVAMALLKMNASQNVLQDWLNTCNVLSASFPKLWVAIARISLELRQLEMFDNAIHQINDINDLQLLKAFRLYSEGNILIAITELEQVKGENTADALLVLSNIVVDLEPTEIGHIKAITYLDRSIQLKPESIVLKLVKASHLQAKYSAFGSSVYLPSIENETDIHHDLGVVTKILAEMTSNSSIGSFERFLTADIRLQFFELLPTVPALIPLTVNELITLSQFMNSRSQRRIAVILASIGETESAKSLLTQIGLNGDHDDSPTETKTLLSNMSNEDGAAIQLPPTDNISLEGMSDIRRWFLGAQHQSPDLAGRLLNDALSSPLECSFTHEMLIVNYIKLGEIASAKREIQILQESFPNAVCTWCVLLSVIEERCNTSRTEKGSADIPTGSLDIALQIAEQVCELVPIDEHYAKWISFAACDLTSKTNILDRIGEHAESKGSLWATHLSRALACEDRKDFEGAAANFDAANAESGLSADMRALRDQCKWFANQLDDLAAGAEELLRDKKRHPGQVQATVSAMRELGRKDSAIDVANANLRDFPESEIANWIVVNTARELGGKDFGILFAQFTEKFPDSDRIQKVEVSEDSVEIVDLMDLYRKRQENLQAAYARCDMPLIALPDHLALSYHRQSELLVGLQTTRIGFGINLASPSSHSEGLLVDATAALTLSKFGIWRIFLDCKSQLYIPDFVVRELRAEVRMLEIEKDDRAESRLDRVNQFLRRSDIRVYRNAIGPDGMIVENLTCGEEDDYLASTYKLTVVKDQTGSTCSIRELISIAHIIGKISSADYFALPSVLQLNPVTSECSNRDLPSRILIDHQTLEILAHLSAPESVIRLFDEVWVGPTAMMGLTLQLGRVETERSSRQLLQRTVSDLKSFIEKGELQIVETLAGRLEDLDYLSALCAVSCQASMPVLVDDMATRRFLTVHDPSCQSLSTLELLSYLGQAQVIPAQVAERLYLELVDGGHRDSFYPHLVLWGRGSNAGQAQVNRYIRRLSWQVEQNFTSAEEQDLYFKLLIQNLSASVNESVERLIELLKISLEQLSTRARELIWVLLISLYRSNRKDSFEIAKVVCSCAESMGKFNVRGWSYSQMQMARERGFEMNLSGFSEQAEFSFWFNYRARLARQAIIDA